MKLQGNKNSKSLIKKQYFDLHLLFWLPFSSPEGCKKKKKKSILIHINGIFFLNNEYILSCFNNT